jgi:hypothetical protein
MHGYSYANTRACERTHADGFASRRKTPLLFSTTQARRKTSYLHFPLWPHSLPCTPEKGARHEDPSSENPSGNSFRVRCNRSKNLFPKNRARSRGRFPSREKGPDLLSPAGILPFLPAKMVAIVWETCRPVPPGEKPRGAAPGWQPYPLPPGGSGPSVSPEALF